MKADRCGACGHHWQHHPDKSPVQSAWCVGSVECRCQHFWYRPEVTSQK